MFTWTLFRYGKFVGAPCSLGVADLHIFLFLFVANIDIPFLFDMN
jgi:hypothetical protein